MRVFAFTPLRAGAKKPEIDPAARASFPSEARFQKAVEAWFRGCGWSVYHTWDSRRSSAGFPDLVAWHPWLGRTILAELKSETGALSEAQVETLLALAATTTNEVYLWYPSDEGEIMALLRERR